ncbi:hypothetical protein NNJEOMEG_02717 [Fundidesulfovibrio magnetotacticus]|uniref:Uncharacterized protein n=1 Tax=Fundidesulfovibrio magnetotacticus TaxID=2730080 RepID=A0A6V8LXT9_9BACT|nr:hypothetical protein [Fundidesulfovibrio magnetotacticus]GFK94869.1 hypothetical protein NNJEOMEG_02717 [Fundidesulfovibrio magnetotacticus]
MPASPDLPALLRARSLILLERFLGLCDRDPGRPTHGLFDRTFWCYKLLDLANARFQEAALHLALAAPHARPGAAPAIRALARAAVEAWARLRHPDGSVDEVYPFERSFCATSMSAQAAALAWELLPEKPRVDFAPTADWLAARDNPEVANQMAGACAALARIGRITGRERYLKAARDKFRAIAARQLASGCYAEYGGPDVGYATITMALLAGYHEITADPEALDSLRACEAFLLDAVDENGLYDWRATTRRTQFLYPSGLAALRSPVIERLASGLRKDVVINPLWMDDRYSIPLAADYLLAARRLDALSTDALSLEG